VPGEKASDSGYAPSGKASSERTVVVLERAKVRRSALPRGSSAFTCPRLPGQGIGIP
jgi:hypothetical protein